jgi:hypothetical protein
MPRALYRIRRSNWSRRCAGTWVREHFPFYNSLRGEPFTPQRGHPARLNSVRLDVRGTTELHRVLLANGFPYDRHHNSDNNDCHSP